MNQHRNFASAHQLEIVHQWDAQAQQAMMQEEQAPLMPRYDVHGAAPEEPSNVVDIAAYKAEAA